MGLEKCALQKPPRLSENFWMAARQLEWEKVQDGCDGKQGAMCLTAEGFQGVGVASLEAALTRLWFRSRCV